MKNLNTLIISLFLVNTSFAIESLVGQIVVNKPVINGQKAIKIATYMEKYSNRFNIDKHRAAAIAMQESGYEAITTMRNNKPFDVGMYQINIRTIKEYGFDIKRLSSDMDYSTWAFMKVLSNKQKICKKLGREAWSCYHSRTPNLRKKYIKLVNRWYKTDMVVVTKAQ